MSGRIRHIVPLDVDIVDGVLVLCQLKGQNVVAIQLSGYNIAFSISKIWKKQPQPTGFLCCICEAEYFDSVVANFALALLVSNISSSSAVFSALDGTGSGFVVVDKMYSSKPLDSNRT